MEDHLLTDIFDPKFVKNERTVGNFRLKPLGYVPVGEILMSPPVKTDFVISSTAKFGFEQIDCPACNVTKPVTQEGGYHLAKIERGVVGEASKIKEETDEFMDSVQQGAHIMALVELSDLIGAIKAYLTKHHPSMTLDDLLKMDNITQRAFRNGYRR